MSDFVLQLAANLGCHPWCLLGKMFRWTLHPVVVAIRDNKDDIRVLLYSYYTRVGGPPKEYGRADDLVAKAVEMAGREMRAVK